MVRVHINMSMFEVILKKSIPCEQSSGLSLLIRVVHYLQKIEYDVKEVLRNKISIWNMNRLDYTNLLIRQVEYELINSQIISCFYSRRPISRGHLNIKPNLIQ